MSKCKFAFNSCSYLGYQIGNGGVLPEIAKVKAIQDMMEPKTKKDVCAFLGLTGYYQRFVRNYATLAEPLTELTKKNQPEQIIWTPLVEQAFNTLKQDLVSAPIMQNPNFDEPFILQTDTSHIGVGAVLSQGTSEEQPVAYFSRKLLSQEKLFNYRKRMSRYLFRNKSFRDILAGKAIYYTN